MTPSQGYFVDDNAKMLVPGPAKKPTASSERWKHDLYGPSFIPLFLPDPDLAERIHVQFDKIDANTHVYYPTLLLHIYCDDRRNFIK